jgi:hypothetical protein
MNFEGVLRAAKSGDKKAQILLLDKYRPYLIKEALDDGSFDEDVYQELLETTLQVIRTFII